MKKFFKWVGIIIGGLVVIIILVLLIAPHFIDVQHFKPEIQKVVSDATGRKVTLGGEIKLTLFPWAGVTLKDVSLESPEGFDQRQFASFSKFEVRMKLLPLLSRKVEVKHLVLKGLRLVLERRKDGAVNWNFSTGTEKAPQPAPAKKKNPASSDALPIKSLAVGEVSVTGGTILFIDQKAGERKELSDVNIQLTDVSFEKPIRLHLSAKLDKKPLSLTGQVGPLGSDPGRTPVAVDLTAGAFGILRLHVKGEVDHATSAPEYRMALSVANFSPKKLIKAVAPDIHLAMADPSVLGKLSLETKIAGNTDAVSLTGGKLVLDDTTTTFQAGVKHFSKPDITWKIHVDRLNLDRYLPPAAQGSKKAAPTPASATTASRKTSIDYKPLRNLTLDGSVGIDTLKAGGGTVQDVVLKLKGTNGKFNMDPLSMKLYQGTLSIQGDLDVSGNTPKTRMDLKAQGIQAGPLLKDFIKKDFLTGTALARVSLSMSGDTPDRIKQTLSGNGEMTFSNGTIRGMNILGMIQNLQAAFSGSGTTSSNGTDFSELKSTFTLTNGVFDTPATNLESPVLKAAIKGKADLVKETLDFRVDPSWVNPVNRKAGGGRITGNLVPVLITGTFSKPKFRPDLEKAVKNAATKVLENFLGNQSKKSGSNSKNENSIDQKVNSLLNKLPFGK